jgi:exodeoxyribonuclease V alpha subunit
MAENLSGVVERVTFHSPETCYAVLRVVPRGRRGIVTVVGAVPSVTAGEHIEATGTWVYDPRHGEQFKADEMRCTPPSSVEGIEKYLASGLVKGIGPTYARKIVAVFGERTLRVIDESPTFLKEVKGIGPKRIQQIRESWREQKAVRDIMIFLQSHGLTTSKAVRIYKTYGDQAVELVRSNPYRLATDIWGIGFDTADKLGKRLGIDPASVKRARAALRFVLQETSKSGNVGFPEEAVIEEAIKLTAGELPHDVVRSAIEEEKKDGEIVREPGDGEPWLYLKPLFLAELNLARCLHKLQQGEHPLPALDLDAAIRSVEAKMGLELAATQREAIRAATREKVLIVTGGPGVGKSTIVRGILDVFAARGMRCALCAPTGRAAKRLSETTGREAKTIHRLLEVDPALGGFKRNAVNPLVVDLLVVDEASMVDVALMYQLVRAVPKRACLVLVGDIDQLPSVGPGTVLADVIGAKTVPVVRLTEIFRQAEQSWIVRAAHSIRAGELPEPAPAGGSGDFYFVEADVPAIGVDRILTIVQERIPRRFGLDARRDIQVLAPMRRGELGADNLNLRLQEALNPPNGGPEVERFSTRFRVGDKVMQTQNNYTKEVFNGDIGLVASIDETNRELVIDFDGKPVFYDFGELDEITLAYALTIHKCVAGYGLVATEGRGLQPLATVAAGQRIQTGQGGHRLVLDQVRTGEKPIVRVRTQSGYVIDVSEDHPLLVADEQHRPAFCLARALSTDRYACIDRTAVEGHEAHLPPIRYNETHKPEKRLQVPSLLTEEVAWAFGAVVGDGCYRNKRDGSIELTNQDPEVIERYRRFFEGWGLHVGDKADRNHRRLYFTSAPLRRWFAEVGFDYVLADKKKTPAILFGSKVGVRAAYLRGLFDTDGSVGKNNVRFTTASVELASEVHRLLLSLGVVSTLSCQSDRHYKVTVSGTSILLFQERVGFTIRRKAEQLEVLRRRAERGKTNWDIIPFGRLLMQEYQKQLPKVQGVLGRGLFAHRSRRYRFVVDIARGAYRATYAHLRRLLERTTKTNEPMPKSILETVSRNYFYDKIVAVERLPQTTTMYDLEVEDQHSFVVNGFVCHNSQGSEYSAVVIPVHTQHFTMLQRNLLYTGVTRGRKLVVLVGSRRALEMAVGNQDTTRRCSMLRARLRAEEERGGETEE